MNPVDKLPGEDAAPLSPRTGRPLPRLRGVQPAPDGRPVVKGLVYLPDRTDMIRLSAWLPPGVTIDQVVAAARAGRVWFDRSTWQVVLR